MRRLSLLCLLFSAVLSALAAGSPPLVPDSAKTPGDVLTTDAKTICVPGYTKTVREVPQPLKNQIYRSYGILSHRPGEYEIDHLISLELGGSNSIRNLWPQSFEIQPLNAHVKDKLENRLHDLICSGQLPVPQAQQEIAKDWIAAYEKYVGPIPGGKPATAPPLPAAAPPASPGKIAGPSSGSTLATQPGAAGGCPSTAPVKVSKSGIYHGPGDPDYGHTKAKSCFATPEAAAAAGYRAPKR